MKKSYFINIYVPLFQRKVFSNSFREAVLSEVESTIASHNLTALVFLDKHRHHEVEEFLYELRDRWPEVGFAVVHPEDRDAAVLSKQYDVKGRNKQLKESFKLCIVLNSISTRELYFSLFFCYISSIFRFYIFCSITVSSVHFSPNETIASSRFRSKNSPAGTSQPASSRALPLHLHQLYHSCVTGNNNV